MLPGTNINNGWLLAMDEVGSASGDPTLRPNLRRYRMLQSLYVYEHHYFGSITRDELDELRDRLPGPERMAYTAAFSAAALGARVLPASARRLVHQAFALAQRQTPYWRPANVAGRFSDMRDVLDHYDRRPASGAARV